MVSIGLGETINLSPPISVMPQFLVTPGSDNLVGTDSADVLVGSGGFDQIKGLGGDDIIYGNKGNDVINGDSGNDSIFGGKGDDILVGGADNDRLEGKQGDDVLDGGLGQDILIGGPGSDQFLLQEYGAENGDFLPDFILDFQVGIDKIILGGLIVLQKRLTLDKVVLNFEEGNTIIKVADSNETLGVVVGVTPTQLNGSFTNTEFGVLL